MCVMRGNILNLLTVFSEILSKCLHKDILLNSKSGQSAITFFFFFLTAKAKVSGGLWMNKE